MPQWVTLGPQLAAQTPQPVAGSCPRGLPCFLRADKVDKSDDKADKYPPQPAGGYLVQSGGASAVLPAGWARGAGGLGLRRALLLPRGHPLVPSSVKWGQAQHYTAYPRQGL